jgi:hypothetical protein
VRGIKLTRLVKMPARIIKPTLERYREEHRAGD